MFINIVVLLFSDRPSGFFFRARFIYFHTLAFLLFFVLVNSCCFYLRVFRKTLVHEFPISYSHTEWYIRSLFGAGETKHAQRTLL